MTTPRRNRLDFHCHSSRSDGVLPPLELYAQMREFGMRLVSLTDHDTLDGYRELRAEGLGEHPSPAGPQLIPGVEINTVLAPDWPFPRDEIHVLGLGVDPEDAALESALATQRALRRERFESILGRLRRLGVPIDDELARILPEGTASAGRPHVARVLIDLKLAASVDDAFERYLRRGAPAYVPRSGLGPRDAIEAIRHAGGVASLAHYPDTLDRPALLDRLMEWGLNGLEVHYFGRHHAFPPESRRRLSAFAAERGLVATGGTDYHGDGMSYAEAQAGALVPDEVGERLLAAIRPAPATAG